MKQLILFRHAKSDWVQPGIPDHDRLLNARGLRDAPQMAAALVQRGVKPDGVVSSTAKRAATTAEIISSATGFSLEEIDYVPDLYLAPPATILHLIQQLDETSETVFLFGHNPGMHELVNLLSKGTGVEEFPTLAVARFEFECDFWGEVDQESGLLLEVITPRALLRE